MRALVALGALELLVLAGLAGSAPPVEAVSCTDPAVAAQVGGVAITEVEVQDVVAQVRDALAAVVERDFASLTEAQRQQELAARIDAEHPAVLERRILTEAARSYTSGEGLELPVPDIASTAARYGLSTESDYVRVVAEYEAAMAGLTSLVLRPVAPSEADQREVYENVVAQGLTTTPFEQAQPMLTQEVMGGPVALRDLIVTVVDEADICVSDRYQLAHRVPVAIGGEQSWLSVAIGDPASAGEAP